MTIINNRQRTYIIRGRFPSGAIARRPAAAWRKRSTGSSRGEGQVDAIAAASHCGREPASGQPRGKTVAPIGDDKPKKQKTGISAYE